MITTITFNAAIDKRYYVKSFTKGEVQRVIEVENTAGGKGLNVTRVASILGEKITATGFLGGANGSFIRKKLIEMDVIDKFQEIKGETRNCLAIMDEDGNQTEFLEPGPHIEEDEFENWLDIYKELLDKSSIIIASGSLPNGLKTNTYGSLIKEARKRGIKFFLDTSGEALLQGIDEKPFFIKPNADELKLITKKANNTKADIVAAILELQHRGIELITVSLGAGGSITGYKDKLYEVVLPKVEILNPVGSGDSFVAGMAVAFKRGMDIEQAIAFASACGTANAMEKSTGYLTTPNVELIMKNIVVKPII